jgi:hypothetical protein
MIPHPPVLATVSALVGGATGLCIGLLLRASVLAGAIERAALERERAERERERADSAEYALELIRGECEVKSERLTTAEERAAAGRN